MRKRIAILVVAIAATASIAGMATTSAAKAAAVGPGTTWCVAGQTISLNFSGDSGEFDYLDALWYQESVSFGGFWFDPTGDVGEEEGNFGTAADNPSSLYPGRDEPLFDEDDAMINPDGTPSSPWVFYSVSAGACVTASTRSGPDTIAVCSSHSGTDTNPDFITPAQQPTLMAQKNPDGSPSYWLASATLRTVAGDTNVLGGTYTLVCNPSTTATGQWVGHDGKTLINNATEASVQIGDGPNSGATRETQFYQVVG